MHRSHKRISSSERNAKTCSEEAEAPKRSVKIKRAIIRTLSSKGSDRNTFNAIVAGNHPTNSSLTTKSHQSLSAPNSSNCPLSHDYLTVRNGSVRVSHPRPLSDISNVSFTRSRNSHGVPPNKNGFSSSLDPLPHQINGSNRNVRPVSNVPDKCRSCCNSYMSLASARPSVCSSNSSLYPPSCMSSDILSFRTSLGSISTNSSLHSDCLYSYTSSINPSIYVCSEDGNVSLPNSVEGQPVASKFIPSGRAIVQQPSPQCLIALPPIAPRNASKSRTWRSSVHLPNINARELNTLRRQSSFHYVTKRNSCRMDDDSTTIRFSGDCYSNSFPCPLLSLCKEKENLTTYDENDLSSESRSRASSVGCRQSSKLLCVPSSACSKASLLYRPRSLVSCYSRRDRDCPAEDLYEQIWSTSKPKPLNATKISTKYLNPHRLYSDPSLVSLKVVKLINPIVTLIPPYRDVRNNVIRTSHPRTRLEVI